MIDLEMTSVRTGAYDSYIQYQLGTLSIWLDLNRYPDHGMMGCGKAQTSSGVGVLAD